MFEVFGKGGMTPVHKFTCDRGVKITAFGYAGALQEYVIVDDQMNAVEIHSNPNRDPEDVGDELPGRYFSWRHRMDNVRDPRRSNGIGFYFSKNMDEPLVDEETIQRSLKRADALDRLKVVIEERNARLKKEDRERCLRDYKHLTLLTHKDWKEDRKICGDNIRKELKKAFPNTKFSVRYKSFSGGDEYTISWEDGPITKRVDAVVDKFQIQRPDEYSQGDYWDPVPTNFTGLYGGVGYIMTDRDISDDARSKARDMILAQYPNLTDETIKTTLLDFCPAYYGSYFSSIAEAASQKAHAIDWEELDREEAAKMASNKPSPATNGSLSIIDYSERSIALIGDTKAVKDTLHSLGGRFNPKLSCGAGWVFPKTKEDELRKSLGL